MRKRYNTPHRSRVVKTRMTEEEYAEFAEKLKFELVGNPVEMKQAMKQDNYAQAKELAKAMADRLKADRK